MVLLEKRHLSRYRVYRVWTILIVNKKQNKETIYN